MPLPLHTAVGYWQEFLFCFFGAAINTMAGWLYVISGVSFALLAVAAVLPAPIASRFNSQASSYPTSDSFIRVNC